MLILSWLRRWGFRTLAVFLLGVTAMQLCGQIPVLGVVGRMWHAFWGMAAPWAGQTLFRVSEPIQMKPTGSGDTLFHWVVMGTIVLIAVVTGLVWSFFDRARQHDGKVAAVLRVLVRYALGGALLAYGFAKVFHLQMPPPDPARLITPYGASSPMGLLWTFMGVSPAYSFFAGIAEVVPGILLLFRRTTHLGALMAAAVMLHVVMLNFCFDVPVKLYSSQLLVEALFLAAPDFRRLLALFVLNRAIEPEPPRRRSSISWVCWLRIAVKLGVIASFVYVSVAQYQSGRRRRAPAPAADLSGLYEVVTFSLDGEEKPPLLTDTRRWRRVYFNRFNYAAIYTMDERRDWMEVEKLGEGNLKLGIKRPNPQSFELTYAKQSDQTIVVEGPFATGTVRAVLKPVSDDSFLLLNRGFHWVSEYPFNR